MMHGNKKTTLSRRSGHRKALIRNLCKSLISHEKITTTVTKAKTLRPVIEKLVTVGRDNSLHTRRMLISKLGTNCQEVSKLIDVISQRYKERNGGYTRIIKCGFRKGDCAPMAIIQFV